MSKSIVAAVSDMIFAAKIEGTARHLAVTVHFARTLDKLLAQVTQEKPALIILDLDNSRFSALEAIQQLKAHSDKTIAAIPILGFLSHVEVELRKRALAAGCNQVLPRSQFSNQLPEILSLEHLPQTLEK